MIYFVQPQGRPFVKIGYARCVGARLQDLQVSHPEELILLGVIAGSRAKESELQARFAHLWVRGEWFRYTREVRLFIQREAVDYQPHVHDPGADDAASQEKWRVAI